MQLNYDFYTFSQKHFKGLVNLLEDYPPKEFGLGDVLWLLAGKGLVSFEYRKLFGTNKRLPFIRFYPHPKNKEFFYQFDKHKLSN
jgi:hypothetical protein